MIVIELLGKIAGHITLDHAGITLLEDQVSGLDIDELLEDSRR